MKRAVILHGTDGEPDSNWFRWLEAKFVAAGYEVWLPQLPDAHVPNRQTWNDFILGSDFDLADSIVVGHSAGAVEVLNLLSDERTPHVKLCVLVSAWPAGFPVGDFWEPGQFDHLFPTQGYDFTAIAHKASKLAFVHGSDDPYCPLPATQKLVAELSAPLTIIPSGQHLGDAFPEFPELWKIIDPAL